nr:polysaccharide biosynthesis protein [uncultured Dyadobacter sp.]
MHTRHTCSLFPFTPEDLLGREPITLDTQDIAREISDRTILITGAAGSIGSELAVQVCTYAPAQVILIDQAETALNDLDLYLRQHFPQTDIQSHVSSVTDALRMSEVFSRTRIHSVFHAAAYKHVPFMERNPYEAAKTNILGTEILADLSVAYHVCKFIYISTDKAVRPASVMGATKRFGEIYIEYLAREYPDQTQFTITRFGNVLGSNGSFLIRFARQIQEGGPVTITHPDANRYIMTVTEACQLVLEASSISHGGEILSFDMGRPVRIADIARRMIIQAGLLPEKDIFLEYTGLRPGEKLSEDLPEEENPAAAYHGKIKMTRFPEPSGGCVRHAMSALQKALDSGQPERIVSVLKKVIPEYISANSPFCRLDMVNETQPG